MGSFRKAPTGQREGENRNWSPAWKVWGPTGTWGRTNQTEGEKHWKFIFNGAVFKRDDKTAVKEQN